MRKYKPRRTNTNNKNMNWTKKGICAHTKKNSLVFLLRHFFQFQFRGKKWCCLSSRGGCVIFGGWQKKEPPPGGRQHHNLVQKKNQWAAFLCVPGSHSKYTTTRTRNCCPINSFLKNWLGSFFIKKLPVSGFILAFKNILLKRPRENNCCQLHCPSTPLHE